MFRLRRLCAAFPLALFVISASSWPLFGEVGVGDGIGLSNVGTGHRLAVDVSNITSNATSCSTASNGTTCTSTTKITTPLSVKRKETVLSSLAVILVGATYWLLMEYSPRLVTGICIPGKTLSANMKTILENGWPRKFGDTPSSLWYLLYYINDHGEWVADEVDGNIRFYDLDKNEYEIQRKLRADPAQKIDEYEERGNLLRGFEEVVWKGISVILDRDRTTPDPVVWIQTASSAMRNVIQLIIWEWTSLWLVLIMIFNTLLYNGFLGGGTPTTDRYPRIVLISIYSALYLYHFFSTWRIFLKVYTFVMLQASWAVIFRQPFAFTTNVGAVSSWMEDKKREETARLTFDKVDVDVLGGAAISECYENVYGDCNLELSAPAPYYLPFPEYVENLKGYAAKVSAKRIFRRMGGSSGEETKMDKSVKSLQEAEVKSFEKATETALERITVNTTLLLSICVATGFAGWTQSALPDATSTQIGSYALLVSTSAAFAALFTSASHLNSMKSSAKEILRLTEAVISLLTAVQSAGYTRFQGHQQPAFGFTATSELGRFPRERVRLGTVWAAGLQHEASSATWAADPRKASTRARKCWGYCRRIFMSLTFGPAFNLLPAGREHESALRVKLDVHDRSFVYYYPRSDPSSWSWGDPAGAHVVLRPLGEPATLLVDKFQAVRTGEKGTDVQEGGRALVSGGGGGVGGGDDSSSTAPSLVAASL